jgi:carbamoyl-phosphate synthase small subunit
LMEQARGTGIEVAGAVHERPSVTTNTKGSKGA